MVVSFFRGHPSDRLLPNEAVARAAASVLALENLPAGDENRHPLAYGTDEGARWVREILADWTNRTLGSSLTADLVNLTNGASFGAASALTQCTSADTRRAFVVSPTYFLINKILSDAGFGDRLTAIVENHNGLDLDALEAALRADKEQWEPCTTTSPGSVRFTYVLYLIPDFSNPGGRTLALPERRRLLDLAREFDILVLSDDVYPWLDFSDPDKSANRPRPLVDLDRETLPEGSVGNVVSNFSISKVMGPGLRVGWQAAATPQLAHHLSQTGATISGGTPAQLNSFIVARLIQLGLVDETLIKLNTEYGWRVKAYKAAIAKHFPEGTQVDGGDGGYFLWLTLPPGYDTDAITAECKAEGIVVAPGSAFEVKGDPQGWSKRCYRIAFSYVEKSDALPALETWGRIIAKHAPKGEWI